MDIQQSDEDLIQELNLENNIISELLINKILKIKNKELIDLDHLFDKLVEQKSYSIMELIIKSDNIFADYFKINALRLLCHEESNQDFIPVFKKLGIDIFYQDIDGNTLLHNNLLFNSVIDHNYHLKMTKYIIDIINYDMDETERNEFLNIVNDNCETALHILCTEFVENDDCEPIEIIILLIKNGANIYMQNNDDKSSLDILLERFEQLKNLINEDKYAKNTLNNLIQLIGEIYNILNPESNIFKGLFSIPSLTEYDNELDLDYILKFEKDIIAKLILEN